MDKPSLGFIGTGKVAATLARLWSRAYQIGAIYNRTPGNAIELVRYFETTIVAHPQDVVAVSDLVFLTVADDAINEFVEVLYNCQWDGKGIAHTSGSVNSAVFQPLVARGAMVGSLHPAFPFADVESSVQKLRGSVFAIEAEDELLVQWLCDLVDFIDCSHIILRPEHKSLYHVALVLACNYMVTLYSVAERMLLEIGAEQSGVNHVLNTLLRATVDNIQNQGIPAAMTGPLIRGDIHTAQQHLEALEDYPLIRDVYIQLARLSYPMLLERGEDIKEFEQVFQQEASKNAPHDS